MKKPSIIICLLAISAISLSAQATFFDHHYFSHELNPVWVHIWPRAVVPENRAVSFRQISFVHNTKDPTNGSAPSPLPDNCVQNEVNISGGSQTPVTKLTGTVDCTYTDTDWGEIAFNTRRLGSNYVSVIVCRPDAGDVEFMTRHRRNSEVALDPDSCALAVESLYVPGKRDVTPTRKYRRGIVRPHDFFVGTLRRKPSPLVQRRPHAELVKQIDLWPFSTDEERINRVSGGTVATVIAPAAGQGTPVDELQGIVVLCNRANTCSGARLMAWIRFLGLTPERFSVAKTTYTVGGFEGEVGFDGDNDDIQDEISPSTPIDTYLTVGLGALPRAEPLPPLPPAPGFPGIGPFVEPTRVIQADTPNVQCAKMGCVGCGLANAYAYTTMNTAGVANGFPLIPGYAKDLDLEDDDPAAELINQPRFRLPGGTEPNCPTSLPGDEWVVNTDSPCPSPAVIGAYLRRQDVTNFSNGKGADSCQRYRGILGYLRNLEKIDNINEASEQVRLRHQGSKNRFGDVPGDACIDDSDKNGNIVPEDLGSLPSEASASFDEFDDPEIADGEPGQFVRLEWILEQLSARDPGRRGLFCAHSRFTSFASSDIFIDGKLIPRRQRDGGHAYRCYGASLVKLEDKTRRWIYCLDDKYQGGLSGKASSGLRTFAYELIDVKKVDAVTNDDNRYNLDGTTSELTSCMSIAIKPSFGDDI
jgi:hypothetical protein